MVIKSADEATEPTHSANVATIPAFHLSLRCPIIPSAEFWCYIGKYWFVLCDRPPENKNKNARYTAGSTEAATPKKKQLIYKKNTTSAQLWLSGHGLAPHRMSGAPIPVPCQQLFA